MRAIVLSGGGGKGAYEIGVWKALRKLHIKYDIVTGTSIGAINGMLMVQKDYHKGIRLWQKIDYQKLYNGFDNIENDKDLYLKYLDKALKGGIDTLKIKDMINDNYKPNKIYNSKIKFGVVAYDIKKNEVIYATKNNTPKDKLREYILASATCYPVFKPTKVGNSTLIDGGYYDNVPINLAIDLGADEIIAVDLKAIGKRRKVKDESVSIKYITPCSKLPSFLKFEPNLVNEMINQGYNDTMKAFDKLEGDIYTFQKGTNINNYLKYKKNINKIIDNNLYVGPLANIKKDKIINIIEDALEIFDIPIDNIYTSRKFNKLLIKKLDKTDNIKINNFDLENIKKMLDRKKIVKYIYEKLKKGDKINAVFNFFTKEFTTAIYLLAIRS